MPMSSGQHHVYVLRAASCLCPQGSIMSMSSGQHHVYVLRAASCLCSIFVLNFSGFFFLKTFKHVLFSVKFRDERASYDW